MLEGLADLPLRVPRYANDFGRRHRSRVDICHPFAAGLKGKEGEGGKKGAAIEICLLANNAANRSSPIRRARAGGERGKGEGGESLYQNPHRTDAMLSSRMAGGSFSSSTPAGYPKLAKDGVTGEGGEEGGKRNFRSEPRARHPAGTRQYSNASSHCFVRGGRKKREKKGGHPVRGKATADLATHA